MAPRIASATSANQLNQNGEATGIRGRIVPVATATMLNTGKAQRHGRQLLAAAKVPPDMEVPLTTIEAHASSRARKGHSVTAQPSPRRVVLQVLPDLFETTAD